MLRLYLQSTNITHISMSTHSKLKHHLSKKGNLQIILMTMLIAIPFFVAIIWLRHDAEIRDPVHEYTPQQNPVITVPSEYNTSDLKKNILILNGFGKKEDVSYTIKMQQNGDAQIQIGTPRFFRPGKYKLIVNNRNNKFEQDFSWGVLAINPNKSIFMPNETAFLAIAVLDEQGNMVCDADVKLRIKDPYGTNTEVSTGNDTIKINPECHTKDQTYKPDFETSYKTTAPGTYQMTLNATTSKGSYAISDSFEVRPSTPYDIERETATRIFPEKAYTVKIHIKINEDYEGTIKEYTPDSFVVTPLQGTNLPYSSVTKIDHTHVISWYGSFKKGDNITIGYIYDAPDISPQFFLLGPLELYDKSGNQLIAGEIRRWQIASDAISFLEIQTNTAEPGSTSIASATITGVNNQLYLAAVSTKPNQSVSSVSGLGLTWNLVQAQCSWRQQVRTEVWYALGTVSGNGAVTANFSSAPLGAAIAVARYSGTDTTDPIGNFDSYNTHGSNSAGTSTCTGTDSADDATSFSYTTMDTSRDNAYVFLAVGERARTTTPGSGWTERTDIQSGATGNTAGLEVSDKPFASASTNLTTDGTFSGAVDYSIVAVEIQSPLAATNTPTPTATFTPTPTATATPTPTPAGPTPVSQCFSNWYNSAWSTRKSIVIDHTKVSGGSSLTNFPVMISISNDSNLASIARSDGADIVFTDSTGTILYFEIEKYTNTTGSLIAWVNIPSLSNSVDTTIYIFYGNSANASSLANPTSLWNSNYKGVWHLSESTNSTRQDSTGNNNGLTDGTSTTAVTGQIDGAGGFDGAANKLTITDGTQTGLDMNGTNTITFEVWNYATAVGGSSSSLIDKETGASNGYRLRENTTGPKFNCSVFNGASTGNANDSANFNLNTWYYVACTSDNSNVNIYKGDAGTFSNPATSAYTSGIGNSTSDLFIGSRSSGQFAQGTIDEVRISDNARSSDWLATGYNNTYAPSTFYTLGTAQTCGNFKFEKLQMEKLKLSDKSLPNAPGNTQTFTSSWVPGFMQKADKRPFIFLTKGRF